MAAPRRISWRRCSKGCGRAATANAARPREPMTAAAPVPPTAAGRAPRARRGRLVALGLALAAAAGAAAWYWSGRDRESTDDAFLAADVYQVNAKVAGRVRTVLVRDNEDVTAGQLLAELETDDYDNRLAAATAALELARAQLDEATIAVGWTDASTQSGVAEAEAGEAAAQARLQQETASLESARAESARAVADRDRYQKLSERAASRQRRDEIDAAATAAEAALLAAQKRVGSAAADVSAAAAKTAFARADRERIKVAAAVAQRRRAELSAAEAALHEAELARADTRIAAPAAGRIAHKAVLAGTYVQPGQSLMAH